MARTLDELYDYLDGLTGRADLRDLTAHLEELEVGDELDRHMQFTSKTYARNLVRAGPHYHLLVLCWKNGQRSPIHDHTGSACGVRVLRGTATETLFERTACGHVKATFSRDLHAGCVCGSEDSDIHQVSNLQDGNADLVTIHIYSPPLMRMGTYSLFDLSRGEELMFVEFSDAAGI